MWETLFRGKHWDESTLATRNGLVSICVSDMFCIGGYCSPNVKLEEFYYYLREIGPETIIRTNRRSYSSMMIADFNAKSNA